MCRASILAAVLALSGLVPACLKEDYHDGAFCSEEGTCPPGQRCSPDGYCLFPCPEPDCVGEDCGCEPRFIADVKNERICWDDGFCHAMCFHPPSMPSVSHCGDTFVCDTLLDECVLMCEFSSDCTNGAICTTAGSYKVCRATGP